jgi:hypothetical protein
VPVVVEKQISQALAIRLGWDPKVQPRNGTCEFGRGGNLREEHGEGPQAALQLGEYAIPGQGESETRPRTASS